MAIGLYIASPIPLFILSEQGYATMGLCLTLLLVAAATAVLLMNRSCAEEAEPAPAPKRKEHPLMGLITLAIYLLLSFLTGAWYITWLVFPIMGAVGGLLRAISDLKEAVEYES